MDHVRQTLRDRVLPVCIVVMWAGMLWARALLSMAMVAFVVAALASSGPTKAWQEVRKERGAWGLILLFIIPLLGFPVEPDKHAWVEAVVMKAPLLALPFTLAALKDMNTTMLRRAGSTIMLLTMVSALLTVWTYLQDAPAVNDSYLRGAVMQVPMDNDHVRYGWALSLVYLILLADLSTGGMRFTNLGKWPTRIMLLLLGIFILLLSSRTGIVGLLIAHAMMLFAVQDKRQRIMFASTLVVLPLLAYAIFPSLRNRVRFMVWDFQNYSRGNYREGLNDGPRVASWQAAVELIRKKPLTGTGFGNIRPRMQDWYAVNRPAMPPNERLVPSQEWLFHGVAAGLPGMILFTIAIALAFRRRSGSMVWKTAWLISVVGFLYETGVEVQHGIYLFAFIMVWITALEARGRSAA